MPTYDFSCRKCSHQFEVMLPFGTKKSPRCPGCGSAKTEKVIAPPVVHFKGSGFFVTDSRTAQKKEEKKTPAPADQAKKDPKTEKTPPAKPQERSGGGQSGI